MNKHQGVIHLYVNKVLMTKKRFRSIPERKRIMNEWNEAFMFIYQLAEVYFEISLYYNFDYVPVKTANKEMEIQQVDKDEPGLLTV